MKKAKNKIILVGGCFDILHFGHIEFLRKAKSFGNYLIVILESDVNVKRLKGKRRPIHNQNQRKEMLLALKSVDEVIILKDKMVEDDYLAVIKKVGPSAVAVTKGDPFTQKKKEQAKIVGAKLIVIPKTKSPSTTQILKSLISRS